MILHELALLPWFLHVCLWGIVRIRNSKDLSLSDSEIRRDCKEVQILRLQTVGTIEMMTSNPSNVLSDREVCYGNVGR